jgi:uncharacterized protein involved in outer membrane biogenesis
MSKKGHKIKRWKWIVGISLAVVVVLVVAAFLILATYDFNKFKPQITDLATQYTGRELVIGGDIELGISLLPTLVVSDVTFQNAAWAKDPHMAKIKRLEIQIAVLPLLRGNLEVSRVYVEKPEFLIEIDKSSKSNLEFDVPQETEEKEPEGKEADSRHDFFKFKIIQITGGTIIYRDHQRGMTETISIAILKFETTEFGAPADIDLNFSYNKLPFQITGSIGQLSGILNPEEQWPLNLTIAALDSTVSVQGHVMNIAEAKGIDLKLAVKGSDVGSFQQFTGQPLPVRGPFEVAGHLTAATLDHLKISDIGIMLGKSSIKGEMALNTTSAKPQIDAKFRSSTLDLRPFIKKDPGGDQAEMKSKKTDSRSDKVFPSEPLNLQPLQQVNANIRFTADQILTHRIALDKLSLESSLKNGSLIVKPLTTNVGGGNFTSSLALSTGGGNVNLTAKIAATKINLGEMLKNLDITQDLDGALDFNISLKGQGKSVAALMAGLDGDVVAVLTDGKMPVEYLNLVGADLTTSLLKIVNPFEKKIDRAQINCAVCDFNINDGLAKSDIIMIDDPEKTLFSSGTLNLKTEGLDFGIHTKPKKGIGTKETGKVSVSLGVITRPFKLGGTLAKPSLGLSPERAAKTVGQAILAPGSIASLFLSHSSDKESPCAAALEIVGEGTPKTDEKSTKKGAQQKKPGEKKEGLGSKIKKLFD